MSAVLRTLAACALAVAPDALLAQSQRQPPVCSDVAPAARRIPTVDDVLQLRTEGMSRQNPFAAFDLRADGQQVAVQVKRPATAAKAHATWSFRWLQSDVAVYDASTARRIALLDGGSRGDSWATPIFAPSGGRLALMHIGSESLDRELYAWDVGKKTPVRVAPGAVAATLRFGVGVPNGLASAYAWIDSVTLVAATLPDLSGTMDADDPMRLLPRAWEGAGSGRASSASVIDRHLPTSIAPAASLGVPLTLWRVDVRTGKRVALLTMPALRGRTPRDILLSQDREWLAFTPDVRPIDASAGPMPTLNRAETEFMLVNVRDGRVLHPLPGRHVTLLRWAADGSSVGVRIVGTAPAKDTIVQISRDGAVRRPVAVAAVPADTTRPQPPTPVDSTRPRVATEIDGRGERLVLRRGSTRTTLLSIDESIASLAVCRRWYIRYSTGRGDSVYARVSLPPTYTPGTRYPVLALIYPGTTYNETDRRTDTVAYVRSGNSWEPALLAARGYLVVEPSIPLHGGGADRSGEFPGDILPAIDSLIAYGVADSTRLGIDGVSFGGFGTVRVIEQTKRFRAASARHGLYDLVSMYGQFNPVRRLSDDAGEHLWAPGWAEGGQGHFGFAPYGNWEAYQQASPLYHVQDITTPVLIVAGEMDYAAPITQSEELFTALNRLGKPVRFIRYAGEGHGNASAVNIRHLFGQMVQWFDAWLRPTP